MTLSLRELNYFFETTLDGISKDPTRLVQLYGDMVCNYIAVNAAYFTSFGNNDVYMNGQSWMLNKIKAVGYDLDEGGHCFGIANMAMQAFLIGDMNSFNQRLKAITQLDVNQLRSDFFELKERYKELMSHEQYEEAAQLNQQITDLTAFFDGIVLYQSTEKYKHLFEDPAQVLSQDANKTLDITHPVERNQIQAIDTYRGAYSPKELETYFNLIKQHLGQHSFSLMLISAGHAINLNYNAESGLWLLVDPNHLPGEEYIHADLLVKQLMEDYGNKKGLVMETKLYAAQAHAVLAQKNSEEMKDSQLWRDLHDDEKLDIKFEDGASQMDHAYRSRDIDWIKDKAIKLKTKPNNALLDVSVRCNDIDSAACQLAAGAKVSTSVLTESIRHKNSSLVELLLDHMEENIPGVVLVPAVKHGDLDVVKALLKRIDKIPKYVLPKAIEAGDRRIIDLLTKYGAETDTDKAINKTLEAKQALQELQHKDTDENAPEDTNTSSPEA